MDGPPQNLARARAASFALLSLIALASAALLLPAVRLQPNALIPDDGYFYAQIAYNLGTLGRSTFDGIHTTSGYHLAWGFMLGAVSRAAALFTLDKVAHLFGQCALVAFITAATVSRFFHGGLARLAAAIFLAVSCCFTEMVIVTPVLLALLSRAMDEPASFGRGRSDLLLLAALPLIRVDLVVVSLAFAAAKCLRDRRLAARMACASLLGAAVESAVMRILFGSFVSVSALLKTQSLLSPAAILEHVRFNTISSPGLMARLATTLLLGALATSRLRSRGLRDCALVVLPLASFFLLHFFLSLLRDWYQVPYQIGFLFIVARNLKPGELVSRLSMAAVALLWLAYPLATNLRFGADQIAAAGFVAGLKSYVPRDAPIFQFDGSGYVGYFAERNVIDGDGLVNDYAYARRLTNGTLGSYLDEERVCYFITDTRRGENLIDVGGLVVKLSEAELVSGIDARSFTWGAFKLYRLRAQRCSRG
jgi:hypothetical protein